MPYTELFTERWKLLAHEPADSQTTEQNSGWKDGAGCYRFLVLLSVGDIQAGGTLDMDIEQATDASGTGAKNVTGKSITQLADTDDDVAIAVEFTAEDVDAAGGFRYLQVEITPATAASELAMFFFGEAEEVPVSVTPWQEIA